MERKLDKKLDRGAGVEWWLLAVVYAFVLVSVAGYASFGRNPGLLARWPEAAGFYGVAFDVFPRVQVWLAFLVLALVLTRRVGVRWLGAFVAVYVLSLGAELLGTVTGFPFGEYAYRDALGVKWLDRVPVLIPLSWFFMALPSYVVARRLYPGRPLAVAGLGSLLLVLWDLSLDPAMSHATYYWAWSEAGAFYGMPLVNLLGWFGTGVVLMWALGRSGAWVDALPLPWLVAFYGSNVLLSWGMVVAAGLVGAALLTPVAYGALVALLLPRARAVTGVSSLGRIRRGARPDRVGAV